MRSPDQLTPDELATLRMLSWIYPDEIVSLPDRDHSKLDALVDDGYIERVDHGDEVGLGYKLGAVHAVGLARLTTALAEEADRN